MFIRKQLAPLGLVAEVRSPLTASTSASPHFFLSSYSGVLFVLRTSLPI